MDAPTANDWTNSVAGCPEESQPFIEGRNFSSATPKLI